MRVGILTFHEIYNPGAFFQAYATMKAVQNLGHDAQIIDYTSPLHRFRPWRNLLLHPKILLSPRSWIESFQKNNAFSRCQKYLNKTVRIKTRKDLSREHFDVILIGSDIVWNYQDKRLGRDPVYFGHYLSTKRLAAYAPSCGAIDLSKPIPDFVKSGLSKFHEIAVRDHKTADLVELVIGKRPEIITDPTLNLDTYSFPDFPVYDSDYFLVYAMSNSLSQDITSKIINFAHSHNLRVISVCYRQNWVDDNLISCNPFEWLARIRMLVFLLIPFTEQYSLLRKTKVCSFFQ